jgi:dCMP deaminase
VHAERNAINFAAARGHAAAGATLYTTHAPCASCAGDLINTGIVRVVFQNFYRSEEGLGLLWAAKILFEQIETAGQEPFNKALRRKVRSADTSADRNR